tara:strand:+ start:637 stop:894 length:258 start_codon:yes stop_codon:yes gene_type:complete
MTNIESFVKPLNSGSPAQPVDNKPLTDSKLSMSELYQLCYHKILNKYTPMDKRFILENSVRDNSSIVNRFAKEVALEAETIFDKQ